MEKLTKKLRMFGVSAICSLMMLTLAFAASPVQSPIRTWNAQALDTVRAKRLGFADAGRLYAVVNVAMYDAVNGIDVAKGSSTHDFALVSPAGAPSKADRRAAAAAAAHQVLSALHPDRAAVYDDQLVADLDDLPSSPQVAAGQEWGADVGQQVVDLRANDGVSPNVLQSGGNGPGEFRADFGSAQFATMDPFAIADPLAFRSAGPPDLKSAEYADALNEVQILGNAAIRDQEKKEIVLFWKGGGGSARPPGEWIKIAMVVADHKNLSLSKSARLFALLGMALGDSVIGAVDSKVTYNFWRPATAIRNAHTDANQDTVRDPTWQPRNGIDSIGGSPEHTSGQSTFAGAGSTILAGFFGDSIRFTFEGDNAIAGPRTFESFSAAAAEAGRVRIFAGIHFEFSNQAGQAAGRGVAEEILATRLLSLD